LKRARDTTDIELLSPERYRRSSLLILCPHYSGPVHDTLFPRKSEAYVLTSLLYVLFV